MGAGVESMLLPPWLETDRLEKPASTVRFASSTLRTFLPPRSTRPALCACHGIGGADRCVSAPQAVCSPGFTVCLSWYRRRRPWPVR